MPRSLKELNLIDNFLFGTLLTYPEFGNEFARILLQVIFGREFGKLKVVPEKVYFGDDTDKHGARLDVFLEEEALENEDITILDVEPESPSKEKDLSVLPKELSINNLCI